MENGLFDAGCWMCGYGVTGDIRGEDLLRKSALNLHYLRETFVQIFLLLLRREGAKNR